MLVDEIPATVNSAAIALIDEQEAGQEGKGSVSGPRSLTAEMRIFVDAFLGNGGKATEAAIAAGVEPGKAAMQACRWLCREAVAAHIKNQVGRFVQSAIPTALRTLVEIAGDPEALRKDRIKAANSLIDIAGLAPHGPGLQVNIGVVNGSQAQQILTEVHQARARRLSDIPPAMPDTELRQIEGALDVLSEGIPDQAGGGQLQGPLPGTCPVPGYSCAHSPETSVSCECPACRGKPAPGDDGFEAFNHSQGDDDA